MNKLNKMYAFELTLVVLFFSPNSSQDALLSSPSVMEHTQRLFCVEYPAWKDRNYLF